MSEFDPQVFASLLQQMQGAQAPQQAPDPMASMTPEQIAQLSAMGSIDDRIGQQGLAMARADALRETPMDDYRTPGGAIGGGIGHVINSAVGGYRANQAQSSIQDLLGQQDAGRKGYMESLAALLRGGGPSAAADPFGGIGR